jgi:hypothetical protein
VQGVRKVEYTKLRQPCSAAAAAAEAGSSSSSRNVENVNVTSEKKGKLLTNMEYVKVKFKKKIIFMRKNKVSE